MHERLIARPFKFMVVGASGALLGLAVQYILTSIVGLHYMASYVVAFVCSLTNNYLWNSWWTFGKKPNIRGYAKYGASSLFTMALNGCILWLLTDICGLWYLASSAIGTLVAFSANYLLSKRLVWASG